MKCSDNKLFTPLYLKFEENMPWPEEESVFYLLSRDGLFLCRNHPFFTSCVPTSQWPGELAGQKTFLKANYPRLPRPLLERIVGFFDLIGKLHSSEAAVLLAWDPHGKKIVPIVPTQIGRVSRSYYGNRYPIDLSYQIPPLPPSLRLIGDIHSHVDGPAYASHTDQSDEVHSPGIHMVIGRIQEEPPQIHCEIISDGTRFRVRDLGLIMEGYHQRRCAEVPQDWLDKVTVQPWTSATPSRPFSTRDPSSSTLVDLDPPSATPRDPTKPFTEL